MCIIQKKRGGGKSRILTKTGAIGLGMVIAAMISGCNDNGVPPDVAIDSGCCCKFTFFLCGCLDDAYGRACTPVSPIEIESGFTLLWPGFIGTIELAGGDDIDQAFPQEGQEWYEYCPDTCGGDCDEGDHQTHSICYVAIQNLNRPYVSLMYGYLEAFEQFEYTPGHNLPDKMLSKYVYYAIDARYPVPEGESAVAHLLATRDGAYQPEVMGENFRNFEKSRAVTWRPTRYKVRYAAHPDVIPPADNGDDNIFDKALKGASFRARQQLSDDPNPGVYDVLQRIEDTRDVNLSMHFEAERVPVDVNAIGEANPLPQTVDRCSQAGLDAYIPWREHLLSEGIHVLIVKKIDYCYDENIKHRDILPDDTCDNCDEAWGFAYEPGNFMVISTRSLDMSRTFLHEFGHNRGLSHNLIQYNVMNNSREAANRGNDISSAQAPAFGGSTGDPIHFPVIYTGG